MLTYQYQLILLTLIQRPRCIHTLLTAHPLYVQHVTHTQVISQAGQVWYPDSAYKTAQAIRDFGLEQLPLFIFANWRGFSGGMRGECHAYEYCNRHLQIQDYNNVIVYPWTPCMCVIIVDMYEEVLKYGSMIVDALREYKQVIYVYLPPNGELRGGAWVVLDPTINPEHMQMYADRDSRYSTIVVFNVVVMMMLTQGWCTRG